MLTGFLNVNFEVIRKTDNPSYADGRDKKLFNLVPIVLFSNYQLTTSTAKLSEDVSQTHTVSLRYKLITSAKDDVDLSIGFDRDSARRHRELTKNKNVKGWYHVRNMLKDYSCFADTKKKLPMDRDIN